MKAITVGCVVHKFSMNLYKHNPNKWNVFFIKEIVKTTEPVKIKLPSGLV